mmetsp:Transcript_117388/g.203987  ORF Transcript_117388/g.203987 Transcript_117388/m.203987 type:complete len:211 (-) Transcript_117388:918-1550(-)
MVVCQKLVRQAFLFRDHHCEVPARSRQLFLHLGPHAVGAGADRRVVLLQLLHSCAHSSCRLALKYLHHVIYLLKRVQLPVPCCPRLVGLCKLFAIFRRFLPPGALGKRGEVRPLSKVQREQRRGNHLEDSAVTPLQNDILTNSALPKPHHPVLEPLLLLFLRIDSAKFTPSVHIYLNVDLVKKHQGHFTAQVSGREIGCCILLEICGLVH